MTQLSATVRTRFGACLSVSPSPPGPGERTRPDLSREANPSNTATPSRTVFGNLRGTMRERGDASGCESGRGMSLLVQFPGEGSQQDQAEDADEIQHLAKSNNLVVVQAEEAVVLHRA